MYLAHVNLDVSSEIDAVTIHVSDRHHTSIYLAHVKYMYLTVTILVSIDVWRDRCMAHVNQR